MNTDPTTKNSAQGAVRGNRGRVWLATESCRIFEPSDAPTVRDGSMRVWHPEAGGGYRAGVGRHRATWAQLRSRSDLFEVVPR